MYQLYKFFMLLILCCSVTVHAQTVRMIVPFAPGGIGDLMSRSIQKHLQQDINEKVVVEFHSGAGTEIGMDLVANANPNEILLLINGPAVFTTAIKKNKLDFYQAQLKPVHHLGNTPFVLAVSKKLGVRRFTEFQALDSKRPISYGSSGVLTATHLAGANVGQATGMNFLHVPYKGGGQAIPDLIGGHIDAMVIYWNSVAQLAQSDQLVLLAVDTQQRLAALPNVPTFKELGIDRITRHGWLMLFSNNSLHSKKITEIQNSVARWTDSVEFKETGFIKENKQPTAQEFYDHGIKAYTAITKQAQD
jgi:hypothetical protein